MSSDDWFRNSTWNDEVAGQFEAKLARARHQKRQYLRIQASILSKRQPRVALMLLERYFAFGDDHFDLAQAYVDQANAHLALDEVEAAMASFEKAIERERVFRNLRTTAATEFPYLIAVHDLAARFVQALEIRASDESLLRFPVDRFRHHAARALICERTGAGDAREEAREALRAAAEEHSGLARHPRVGLVSTVHDGAIERLRMLAGG